MASCGQITPPFHSPYQQAMKPVSLLNSPAYPSPARSDSDIPRYPSESLGIYSYPRSFHLSGPPASSAPYSPSPQPTESWAHLSSGASPLMSEVIVDPWTTGAYDHPVSRSPLPWSAYDDSHYSSSSSSIRDASIFSIESSEHAFQYIKPEGGSDRAIEEECRGSLAVYPYGHSYNTPYLPRFEASSRNMIKPRELDQVSYQRSRSPPSRHSSAGITPRTRTRRMNSTPENASYACNICHRLFQRSYNHKTHMETHNPSRKKEHMCPHRDCERQFVRKTDLDRHYNSVHCKLKQFGCAKCDAHFARKDTLRRHEEDGCAKRNELSVTTMLTRTRSMRMDAGAALHYYSPRPDVYDSRSPSMFPDDSFPESRSGY